MKDIFKGIFYIVMSIIGYGNWIWCLINNHSMIAWIVFCSYMILTIGHFAIPALVKYVKSKKESRAWKIVIEHREFDKHSDAKYEKALKEISNMYS